VCKITAENSIAIIVPMDWHIDKRLVNLAYVVSGKGEILGYTTKNQLDWQSIYVLLEATLRCSRI